MFSTPDLRLGCCEIRQKLILESIVLRQLRNGLATDLIDASAAFGLSWSISAFIIAVDSSSHDAMRFAGFSALGQTKTAPWSDAELRLPGYHRYPSYCYCARTIEKYCR